MRKLVAPATLAGQCDILRSELGLSGRIHEVVLQAAEQLGVDSSNNPPIAEIAAECMAALGYEQANDEQANERVEDRVVIEQGLKGREKRRQVREAKRELGTMAEQLIGMVCLNDAKGIAAPNPGPIR